MPLPAPAHPPPLDAPVMDISSPLTLSYAATAAVESPLFPDKDNLNPAKLLFHRRHHHRHSTMPGAVRHNRHDPRGHVPSSPSFKHAFPRVRSTPLHLWHSVSRPPSTESPIPPKTNDVINPESLNKSKLLTRKALEPIGSERAALRDGDLVPPSSPPGLRRPIGLPTTTLTTLSSSAPPPTPQTDATKLVFAQILAETRIKNPHAPYIMSLFNPKRIESAPSRYWFDMTLPYGASRRWKYQVQWFPALRSRSNCEFFYQSSIYQSIIHPSGAYLTRILRHCPSCEKESVEKKLLVLQRYARLERERVKKQEEEEKTIIKIREIEDDVVMDIVGPSIDDLALGANPTNVNPVYVLDWKDFEGGETGELEVVKKKKKTREKQATVVAKQDQDGEMDMDIDSDCDDASSSSDDEEEEDLPLLDEGTILFPESVPESPRIRDMDDFDDMDV